MDNFNRIHHYLATGGEVWRRRAIMERLDMLLKHFDPGVNIRVKVWPLRKYELMQAGI